MHKPTKSYASANREPASTTLLSTLLVLISMAAISAIAMRLIHYASHQFIVMLFGGVAL